MWPPVGALMWMQHAKSRLQDHHRERVFESAYSGVIRRLSELFADIHVLFPGRVQTIFAATYSELSADIRVFFPGRVPRHIRRHIFAVIRSLFTLILLQANNTNKC